MLQLKLMFTNSYLTWLILYHCLVHYSNQFLEVRQYSPLAVKELDPCLPNRTWHRHPFLSLHHSSYKYSLHTDTRSSTWLMLSTLSSYISLLFVLPQAGHSRCWHPWLSSQSFRQVLIKHYHTFWLQVLSFECTRFKNNKYKTLLMIRLKGNFDWFNDQTHELS